MKDLKLNIELQIKGFKVRIIEQELKISSLIKERAEQRKARGQNKETNETIEGNIDGINRDIDTCNCKIQCYKDSVFGLNALLKLTK